jgi:hypothetical protein
MKGFWSVLPCDMIEKLCSLGYNSANRLQRNVFQNIILNYKFGQIRIILVKIINLISSQQKHVWKKGTINCMYQFIAFVLEQHRGNRLILNVLCNITRVVHKVLGLEHRWKHYGQYFFSTLLHLS